MSAPLPVLMDVGPAVHQRAGLSRYAERLAATILAQEAERIDLSLLYNAHSGDSLPPSLADATSHTIKAGQLRWRLGVLASQLQRREYAKIQKLLPEDAVYHATEHLLPRLSNPTVLTVHDLIFERYPQHHTWRNVQYLRTAMPRYVEAAMAVIAISNTTRDDIIQFYKTPADKIHVIYEGIDESFQIAERDEVERVRQQYSPDRPYLLMVGTLEPRKNHQAAIHALRILKREGFPHRLLCVGGKGWLFGKINALVSGLGLTNDVVFAGYAPEADLPALYSGSDCTLVPSLYEGFGLPVLEGMACGSPVVCSNSSSLPEVAGDAAVLVPPDNHYALADGIRLVLTQTGYANALRAKGLARAAQFKWENCASETADLYEAVSRKA